MEVSELKQKKIELELRIKSLVSDEIEAFQRENNITLYYLSLNTAIVGEPDKPDKMVISNCCVEVRI